MSLFGKLPLPPGGQEEYIKMMKAAQAVAADRAYLSRIAFEDGKLWKLPVQEAVDPYTQDSTHFDFRILDDVIGGKGCGPWNNTSIYQTQVPRQHYKTQIRTDLGTGASWSGVVTSPTGTAVEQPPGLFKIELVMPEYAQYSDTEVELRAYESRRALEKSKEEKSMTAMVIFSVHFVNKVDNCAEFIGTFCGKSKEHAALSIGEVLDPTQKEMISNDTGELLYTVIGNYVPVEKKGDE